MNERELAGVVIAAVGLTSTILLGFVKADLIESDPDRDSWPPQYRKLKERERYLTKFFAGALIVFGLWAVWAYVVSA